MDIFEKIIEKNFSNFGGSLNENWVNETYTTYADKFEFKLVQIINNKLYVSEKLPHSPETRSEAFKCLMLEILRDNKIPDMEFVYYDGDSLDTTMPILVSTSCPRGRRQMLVPDFVSKFWPETYLFDYEEELIRIKNSVETIGVEFEQWNLKESKVFYRGSLNNGYRSSYLPTGEESNYLDFKHVYTSKSDIGTPNFIIDNKEGCERSHKAKFKYLLHLNGGLDSDYSSAFRFGLAACSLVIYGTKNPQKEWWQDPDFFREGEHYVSVRDKKDLIDCFMQLESDPRRAHDICMKGYEYFNENLSYERIKEFYTKSLIRYGELINYDVKKDDRTIEIDSYTRTIRKEDNSFELKKINF
jgi:hypothetical protein